MTPRQGGAFEALGAGCVLTGGGAMLPGMLDQAESQLRVPARTGMPVRLSNMPGELASPMFSTIIGMLLVGVALHANTSHAEDMDGALLALAHQPFGRMLLATAGLGLVAFGVFSAMCARWMRMHITALAPA